MTLEFSGIYCERCGWRWPYVAVGIGCCAAVVVVVADRTADAWGGIRDDDELDGLIYARGVLGQSIVKDEEGLVVVGGLDYGGGELVVCKKVSGMVGWDSDGQC